ncbi:MAG TPA: flagellar hook basal-body protein [Gemmatimonadales bacterium]|nr:flagellar hook basal-body protein [Gemmatimonadales bacterium]
MTIPPGIIKTARTLSYYSQLEDVTANNLANVSTDAFKADRVTALLTTPGGSPVPVQQIDLSQGTFRETGRVLDVALDGPGFLVVGTAAGERLTRGGALHLSGNGTLVDMNGDPVLGAKGPITISGGTVELQGDGTVAVDNVAVDRLRLVASPGAAQLSKEGGGRFVSSTPAAVADPSVLRVRQGAIEESNLDPIHGMVDLVTIQRAYSANISALRALDGVLGTVANDLAKP